MLIAYIEKKYVGVATQIEKKYRPKILAQAKKVWTQRSEPKKKEAPEATTVNNFTLLRYASREINHQIIDANNLLMTQ